MPHSADLSISLQRPLRNQTPTVVVDEVQLSIKARRDAHVQASSMAPSYHESPTAAGRVVRGAHPGPPQTFPGE